MNDLDTQAFTALFRDAYKKCFGYYPHRTLSETESKLFYNKIFDQTGLVVGWKSLKNYSSFIVGQIGGKPENPSIATLDSLARFVMDAPYCTETERKEKESHYPYWFGYKEKFHHSLKTERILPKTHILKVILLVTCFFLIIAILIFFRFENRRLLKPFTDDFHDLRLASLNNNGWFAQSTDTVFWNRRGERPDQLTLFTLRGDNWPNTKEKIGIRNLVLRKITKNCFESEVHLSGFIPNQNWQQAGILLLEDTNFTGKSIRLSIAYNNFFGGYNRSGEIIIQAITSLGKDYGEPEEIAHQPIQYSDSIQLHPALGQSLATSFLRIEKEGQKFRFLYAGGSVSNPAFKEVVSHEFDMHPQYIGLFAMKGFVDSTNNIPAHFTFFQLKEKNCDQ